jgi:hypothetical protein
VVYFDEILFEGDDIKGDLDTIYYSMLWLQPFQNGGRLNFWGGWNFWNDSWNSMKFCMEVMALNITSTPYYLIP